MHTKKPLSILLTLALVLGLMPWTAVNARATAETSITTNESVATSLEWSGDYTVNENVTISGTADYLVRLTGNTTITIDAGKTLTVNGENGGIIGSEYTLTVNGGGSVTVTGSNSDNGIYYGNLIVLGGSVTVNNGVARYDNQSITVTGGELTINGREGFYATNCPVTVSGGTVTLDGSQNGACGVWNQSVTVSGGTVTISGGAGASGIEGDASRLTVNGGTVTINGGEDASGINGAASRLTVNGGTVTINGGEGASGSEDKPAIGNEVRFAFASSVTAEESNDGCDYTPLNAGTTFSAKRYLRFKHAHTFTYALSSDGKTVTATCGSTDCALNATPATLTIAAPARTAYGGTGSASATLAGLSAFNTATGLSVSESSIKYVGRDGTTYVESTTAPTNAGKYTARITVGGKTASVNYEIAKTAPTADAPSATATYGQTLASVTLTNPNTNTAGTWAWADSSASVGNVGTNTFKANFTPSDMANYNGKPGVDVSVTVSPKSIAGATIAAIADRTYTGEAIEPTVTVKDGTKTLTKDTDYTVAYSNNINAANKNDASAPTVTVTGKGNYSDTSTATAKFTITKANATCTAPTAKTDLVYTGSDQALVTEGSATGGKIQYSLDGNTYNTTTPTGKDAKSYTVYYKVVGDKNHNDVAPASIAVSIAKEDQLAPSLTSPVTIEPPATTATITGVSTAMEYSANGTNWTACTDTSITGLSKGVYYVRKAGDANHNASPAATIIVKGAGEHALTVTGGTGSGGYKAGASVSVSATVPAGERFKDWRARGVTLTDEQKTSASVTFTMPGGDVTLSANFEDKPLESVSLPATLSLKVGATQTLTPTFAPSDCKYKAVTWSSADTSVVTVDENGKLTAVAVGGPVNITVRADGSKTAVCAVTVTRASSGGSSSSSSDDSGSSSSSGTPTTTTNNADGSKTETKTNVDGSKTETTTRTDGTKTEVTTKTDGSKTETVTAKDGSTTTTNTAKDGGATTEAKTADGSTGTVKTDANGNTVSAEAKPSEKAVAEAKAAGEPVTLPVEVKSTSDRSNAAEIKIDAPASVSAENPAKVEIPVANLTPSTVVVAVDKNGSEKIVTTSTTTENGVALTVTGDVTLKVVDNAKEFSDVKGDEWFANNVAWSSSHEIMNGMGDGSFAPDAPTTQGMMEQILYNIDGNDLVKPAEGETWWTAADSWAANGGVTDGLGETHDPAAPATREADILMMYNYAMSKGYDVSARADLNKFSDASSVSAEARDAMAWAVAVGIIQGSTDEHGNVVLDAQGVATRAQVSTMAERFCEKVAK